MTPDTKQNQNKKPKQNPKQPAGTKDRNLVQLLPLL